MCLNANLPLYSLPQPAIAGSSAYLLLERIQDAIHQQLLQASINVTGTQVGDHLQVT
jgi:hypothetical protein